MATKTPKWKEFESLIADIHRQLAPDANVRHNHKVMGLSGRERQLDVTISKHIGVYPIFVAIECKQHKRPIGLKEVEAFVPKLRDVRASLGIIISSSGFDDGAKSIANQNNILLLSFREATQADWNELIGEQAWLTIIQFDNIEIKEVSAKLTETAATLSIPSNVKVYDGAGTFINSLIGLLADALPKLLDNFEGLMMGAITIKTGLRDRFLMQDSNLVKVEELSILTNIVCKKYPINLNLVEGKVLEDVQTGKTTYRELVSNFFHRPTIIENQVGVDITVEDYNQLMRNPTSQLFIIDTKENGPYFNVTLTEKSNQESANL
jgi:hypothetical protein